MLLRLPSHCRRAHRDLPSFPTRRSSDLADPRRGDRAAVGALVAAALAGHCAARAGDRTGERAAAAPAETGLPVRSEEHTSELQSRGHLVCRLLLEKKNKKVRHTRYARKE